MWIKIYEKKTSVFSVLNLFTFFKAGEIMVSKYEHLMPPGVFPDKIIPVIHFTDETVVLCDVLVVKILLQVLVIYKMITNKF